MQIKGWCLRGVWTKIMKHKYSYFCHLHGKTIFEMIIPFECSAVKDRRLWLMYSICSAPSDSNPDWCQLSGIILFAPHPFCAAISPSIPSYSTVTPNVTLIHPPPSLQLLLWDFRYNVCWNYKAGRNHECQREQRDFLCSLNLIPIFFFMSSLSSTCRLQITTSLRVWSVAGVPHWCWVKGE